MPTNSIYELTNQLARICIRRQRAVQQIAQSNEEEAVLLVRIERERAVWVGNAAAAANDNNNNNPFVVGNTVRIINRLRDEYGIVGVVVTSNRRLVGIRGVNERKIYTQEWWNLEHHRPASPDIGSSHQTQ